MGLIIPNALGLYAAAAPLFREMPFLFCLAVVDGLHVAIFDLVVAEVAACMVKASACRGLHHTLLHMAKPSSSSFQLALLLFTSPPKCCCLPH